MKKILLLLVIPVLMVACNKENKRENSAEILTTARLKMDIQSGFKQAKALDIIGDSAAVHTLSRYMLRIFETAVNYGPNNSYWQANFGEREFMSSSMYRKENEAMERDTLNHTFSFRNREVVCWTEIWVDGGWVRDEESDEYLGWLVCGEDIVFVGVYDTVLKRYRDPMFVEKEGSSDNYMVLESLHDTMYYPGAINNVYDTLGYIPNSLMRSNRAVLEKMLKEKRYQDMLDFFKTGYHIYTCTGAEYRELVRQGLN